jgi:hypothetical protein
MRSWYRFPLSFIALSLVVIQTAGDGYAQQQSCGTCAPSRVGDPSGVSYRFADNVPGHVRDAFNAAAKEFQTRFGGLLTLTLDQAAGSFLISVDPSLGCGIASARWTKDQKIELCPLVASSTNSTVAPTVASHEWGHQAGFGDRESGCWGQTVMAPINWTGQNPTRMTWPDDCVTYYQFVNPAYCQPPYWGCSAGYWWDPHYCACVASPVLLTLGANDFRLTSIDGGVDFDLNGDGTVERVSWTAADGDDAFLWLDRNGNGVADGGQELFGNVTPMSWTTFGPRASHGFEALGYFDLRENGGVTDGWIDVSDRVFTQLRLWRDSNHDGVSQPNEILTLRDVGVERISLSITESRRRDQHGNLFRYNARVQFVRERGARVNRLAYDVYLGTR